MILRPYPFRHALTLVFIVLLSLPGFSQGTTVDRILATIDDQVITLADYKIFIKGLSDRQADDSIDEKLLRQLIEEKMIALEAKRRGLEARDEEVEKTIEEFKSHNSVSQDDFETLLKEDGMDFEKFRTIVKERILISQILSSDVDGKVLITDQELEDFYQRNKREFLDSAEQVEIKAIFLLLREGASLTEITDMKKRALRIVALLRDGENFERLVDEYSDEPLKSDQGLLGKFTRGALIAPLDRKAFSMKGGEISDPVWVGDGVFILQLTNRTEESYKLLEEVKGKIHDILFRQKREKVFNDWIKALGERSSVRIYQN